MSTATKDIMVINVVNHRFMRINPTTDCHRCGVRVKENSPVVTDADGTDLQFCEYHCAGCEETSSKPNPMGDWITSNQIPFRAPICNSCWTERQKNRLPSNTWITCQTIDVIPGLNGH